MATIRLPPDFKEFLQLLNENQVEYLLVGGYAVGYHRLPPNSDAADRGCFTSRRRFDLVQTSESPCSGAKYAILWPRWAR